KGQLVRERPEYAGARRTLAPCDREGRADHDLLVVRQVPATSYARREGEGGGSLGLARHAGRYLRFGEHEHGFEHEIQHRGGAIDGARGKTRRQEARPGVTMLPGEAGVPGWIEARVLLAEWEIDVDPR